MNKEIGRRIKIKRLEKELTLNELGEMVGVAGSTIMRYEKGEINAIKLPVIESIANALSVNPAWLVLKSENPEIYVPNKFDVKRIPLIGRVAAGTPILAEENIEDYFNIDKSLDADFALRVKGDSMIDAEIYNDNIAFIKKQEDLENGEIGVILIDDEATLKRFYKNDGSVILQPENKNYNPIILTKGDVHVLGKLIAVLRKF